MKRILLMLTIAAMIVVATTIAGGVPAFAGCNNPDSNNPHCEFFNPGDQPKGCNGNPNCQGVFNNPKDD